jgi:hypothetical protein
LEGVEGVGAPETPLEASKTAKEEADAIEHLDASIIALKLTELSDLISDDDTRAIRKLGEVKDYLDVSAMRGDLTALEKALAEYDFEKALEELVKIMEKIGIG